MLATKSIVKVDFEPLTGDLSVKEVKRGSMDVGGVVKWPVVDSATRRLIGQISSEQLMTAGDKTLVSDLELEEPVKIYQGQHIFEAARLMLQHELRWMPVVDEEQIYLGVISKDQVLESLSQMLNLAEYGSVITVSIDPIDFTISEIVQIIETEGAKILGITVEPPHEAKQSFEVSIKLNVRDVSRVTAALSRYDYIVLTESENTVFGNDLENRADELLKYIDM